MICGAADMAKDWLEAIKYAKGRTLANPDTTPEAECAKLLAFLKQGQWLLTTVGVLT